MARYRQIRQREIVYEIEADSPEEADYLASLGMSNRVQIVAMQDRKHEPFEFSKETR